MGRKSIHHAHSKSDANAFGGMVDPAHILPMTNAKQEEIRDATDINKMVKAHPDATKRRLRLIRAKQIETQANIATQAQNKGPDLWHVLVESKTGKKVKMAAMSRAEAWRRNPTIKFLGLEWTLGEM